MLSIHEILRASSVKRWNIVRTVHTQNVAEHSFNVCAIARHLCKMLNIDDVGVMKAALEHDLDEVVYGDISTPLKEKLIENGNHLDLAELNEAPRRNLTELEKFILKFSDLLEASLFLQYNWMDRHGESVVLEIKSKVRKLVKSAIGSGVITSAKGEMIFQFIKDIEGEVGGRIYA